MEAAACEEETRLRRELAEAEALREVARHREIRARDAADEARRRADRNGEFLRGELSELKHQIAVHERQESEDRQHEVAWREELDRLVLEQAEGMARRDELASEVARLGSAVRQDSAKADATEAKVRKAEEKRKEDRACVELLRKELEARCREAAAAQEEQRLAAANLERQRKAGEAETRPWRLATQVLFMALVLASLVQAARPELG